MRRDAYALNGHVFVFTWLEGIDNAMPQQELAQYERVTVRGVTFQASLLLKSNASPELLAHIILAQQECAG